MFTAYLKPVECCRVVIQGLAGTEFRECPLQGTPRNTRLLRRMRDYITAICIPPPPKNFKIGTRHLHVREEHLRLCCFGDIVAREDLTQRPANL